MPLLYSVEAPADTNRCGQHDLSRLRPSARRHQYRRGRIPRTAQGRPRTDPLFPHGPDHRHRGGGAGDHHRAGGPRLHAGGRGPRSGQGPARCSTNWRPRGNTTQSTFCPFHQPDRIRFRRPRGLPRSLSSTLRRWGCRGNRRLPSTGAMPRPAASPMISSPPRATRPSLRGAQAKGHRTIDGLSMLIGQAAVAFETFFGQPAPREHDTELRERLTR